MRAANVSHSQAIRLAAAYVTPFTYGLYDLGDRAAAGVDSYAAVQLHVQFLFTRPSVAALQTCNVSHIADVLASNRRLPIPLQVSSAIKA
jgi:hypothetical protein